MRIRIKGEITAERLAEALNKALKNYESFRPGSKIYGANLYLNAFDSDGTPFDLIDHSGKSLLINMEANSGELVKPALTAEGEKRRQEAIDEAERENREYEEKAAEERKKSAEKYHQECIKRQERATQARNKFKYANAITAELLKSIPDQFVDELNKTVQGVWNDLKPVEPHGKKKGQPKAFPVFSIHDDGLLISLETWKNPRRILNPTFTLQHGDFITPIWAHDAWKEAMNRIGALMKTLSASTPAATESRRIHLPCLGELVRRGAALIRPVCIPCPGAR